ncbi:Calcium permeable stress-gated cation channel 1 N-terminal transmembrane domain [Trinorchestia longiramus]|nr:Calcium permeable stress-gated cation channel 1 N-terminal transmembrane domain [Trinorchestia longiramus]
MSTLPNEFDPTGPEIISPSSLEPPTTTPFPFIDDAVKCNQYVVKNKTHLVYGGYEGIPENLLINFIGWIILLCLFTILRKRAWNYGRLAIVQKYDNRRKEQHLGYSQYNVWTQLFYGAETDSNQKPSVGSENDSVASYDFNLHIDQGTFSWIPAIFKIKDAHILRKSGCDAVHYLSFQRHMIVYVAVVCVICISVVLPINFQGTLEGGEKEFGHTTISNLSPSSPFMWVHITLAFLFLPLGIAFTRHHSRLLHINEATDLDPNASNEEEAGNSSVSRTVMITHVPRRSCHKDTLLRHFQEAYPDVEVVDVQFAYGIKDLILYNGQRELAHRARLYCEGYEKDTGERLLMRPYKCGVICGCCDIFGCPKVDAHEYYTQLESCLASRVETEKVKALQRPTGIAFVTLDSRDSALRIMKDHKSVPCRCMGEPAGSSVSDDLKPQNWIVKSAPAPSNIYWKNLSVTTRHWWAKALAINAVLFLVLFFLTTPAVVINSLDFVFLTDKLEQMSPVLSEFFPTLLLWTMAALMPVLVAYSDQFMSHWTRSAENHAVMRKTFSFLLFMVIILPSLGLTSAKALVEWIADPTANNATYRWECIFLPDNGAFFVNYIITSAFIGTSLELIRFPELFMYIIRLALARSEAETASVRRAILYEFQFGVQYAWMMLIFAMTIIYSISCPLITPFGLVYMIFKHFVDKYNIYFAYGPSRISKNIHATAVNFVMVSIVLLQLCLLFFSVVRQGIEKARSIYSLVLLCITLLVVITHLGLHWFKDLSPIDYQASEGAYWYKTTDVSTPDGGAMSAGGDEAETTSTSSQVPGVSRSKQDAGVFVPDVLKDNSCSGNGGLVHLWEWWIGALVGMLGCCTCGNGGLVHLWEWWVGALVGMVGCCTCGNGSTTPILDPSCEEDVLFPGGGRTYGTGGGVARGSQEKGDQDTGLKEESEDISQALGI